MGYLQSRPSQGDGLTGSNYWTPKNSELFRGVLRAITSGKPAPILQFRGQAIASVFLGAFLLRLGERITNW